MSVVVSAAESSHRSQAAAEALIVFVVGEWKLALPLTDIRQVVPLPLLQPLPGAPRYIDGFFNFQGEPVAALRLDTLMGIEPEELGLYAPLIVLDVGGVAVAIRVRHVEEVLRPGDYALQLIDGKATFNACITARIDHDGETIYLISKDELLMIEERAAIAAHGRRAAERMDALKGEPVGGLETDAA